MMAGRARFLARLIRSQLGGAGDFVLQRIGALENLQKNPGGGGLRLAPCWMATMPAWVTSTVYADGFSARGLC